jgi:putative transcriptional regulator
MSIKVKIDELLKKRGRTRYWLVKQTGITYPAVMKLCEGETQRIEFSTLSAICNALECQPGELLENINNVDEGVKG